MKIEDLKVGDVLESELGFDVDVKLVSKSEAIIEYQDGSGYNIIWQHELDNARYKIKPNTKKLYAYRYNGNIIFNTQDYYMVSNEGIEHERAPQFDIEYKE